MKTITVREVAGYYKNELAAVEEEMCRSLANNVPSIFTVAMHLVGSGGKRIRPLLVILSAKLAGYNGHHEDIVLANIIETIHTASLLHDDIVDNARVRRGKPSANSIWGNQLVILVGDYLYSNALRLAAGLNRLKIIEILSMAISSMTQGELLQLKMAGDVAITEADYLEIIKGKTAVLMSAACTVGGIISNVSEDKERALSKFGLKVGLTFQLVDDVLDFRANEEKLGKNLGNDLREGKITYPLIHLLSVAEPDELIQIKNTIQSDNFNSHDLAYIVELLEKYLCIDKAYEKARLIVEEAKKELDIFEDSSEKLSLLTIADYALTRDQ